MMKEDLILWVELPFRFIKGVLMFLFYEIPRDINCRVAHGKYRTDDNKGTWIEGEQVYCGKCGKYNLFA